MFFAVSAQSRPGVGKSAVVALALAASVLLAGCQNKASISGSDGLTTGSDHRGQVDQDPPPVMTRGKSPPRQ